LGVVNWPAGISVAAVTVAPGMLAEARSVQLSANAGIATNAKNVAAAATKNDLIAICPLAACSVIWQDA
jgi:hypothetical protein